MNLTKEYNDSITEQENNNREKFRKYKVDLQTQMLNEYYSKFEEKEKEFKQKLQSEIDSLKRKHNLIEPQDETEINYTDVIYPKMVYDGGFITLHRGILDGHLLIPHFDDQEVLNALGLSAEFSLIDKPSVT